MRQKRHSLAGTNGIPLEEDRVYVEVECGHGDELNPSSSAPTGARSSATTSSATTSRSDASTGRSGASRAGGSYVGSKARERDITLP